MLPVVCRVQNQCTKVVGIPRDLTPEMVVLPSLTSPQVNVVLCAFLLKIVKLSLWDTRESGFCCLEGHTWSPDFVVLWDTRGVSVLWDTRGVRISFKYSVHNRPFASEPRWLGGKGQ